MLRKALHAAGGAEGDDARVAVTLTQLGSVYADEGRYAEGELLYQRSIQVLEKTRGRF
jgi:hypothetical protein